MRNLGKIQDNKDVVTKEYVDGKIGEIPTLPEDNLTASNLNSGARQLSGLELTPGNGSANASVYLTGPTRKFALHSNANGEFVLANSTNGGQIFKTDGTNLNIYNNVVMNNRRITGLPNPATNNEPVTKIYADTALGNKADKSATYTKAEVDERVNKRMFTPNGSSGQFMAYGSSGWTAMESMPSVEALAGATDTARTISPNVLRTAIKYHRPQPDWNAPLGDGSEILNKPDLSKYALKSEISGSSNYKDNGFFIEASPQAVEENGLKVTTATSPEGTKFASVAMGPKMKQAWQNAIGVIPYMPKQIYGMIRGRIGGNAQTMSARQTMDIYWDHGRKVEQNITYSTNDANNWVVPEDGIYTITAGIESVDVPNPFEIKLQRQIPGQSWQFISPGVLNSYPGNGRGTILSATLHLTKGEKVNVVIINQSDGPTRVGESELNGTAQCYFTITRVALYGNSMPPAQSMLTTTRLVKEIPARINVSGKDIKYSYDVPTEFKGRKYKATFKLVWDYHALNATKDATTEVYRKDWIGSRYVIDQKLFNRTTSGFHNYMEVTEIYESNSDVIVMDMILVDRDNVSSGKSAHGKVILETID